MIKQLKLFIIYKLSLYHYFQSARKYVGGNWEYWYIDCIRSDLWFQVKKKLIKEFLNSNKDDFDKYINKAKIVCDLIDNSFKTNSNL